MFEKEIKFIADFSLNKLKKLGSSLTFEKIISTDIHPAIIQYISAELDYLIFEDRKKLLQKSVFDYSGPEITKHLNAISRELKKNKKISYEDVKKLVIQAVSFNVNFTVRPNWSLMKLIYEGANRKTADEIKLVLNSVYYYDYIKNVVINYMNKKEIQFLNSNEFEAILNKVDKALFSTKAEQLVDNMLYSIADFYNVGEVNRNKVSVSKVEIFLKEKNLIDYLTRLRKALSPGAKQIYVIEDMKRILFTPVPAEKQVLQPSKEDEIETEVNDKVSEETGAVDRQNEETKEDAKEENDKTVPAFEEEANEETKTDDEINIVEKSSEEIKDETPEESNLEENVSTGSGIVEPEQHEEKIEAEPENDEAEFNIEESEEKEFSDPFDELKQELDDSDLFKEFDIEDTGSIEEFEFDTDEPDFEKFDEEQPEQNTNPKAKEKNDSGETSLPSKTDKEEKDKTIFQNSSQEDKKEPVPKKRFEKDIFNFLTDKEIARIVSSIFNEDREDFANTMERLMECSNYEESTEILKSVFLTYRINPYSKDAVTLTNAVSNYFDQA